ncbi:MAG: hypothetical protein JXO22_13730 [Phycisphaerae bacterium]|nr:hypothetical protein [Phycisphaerae bacterium]
MKSTLILVAGLLLLAPFAAAQTYSPYDSPMDAVSGGNVQARSPGVAIRRAVAAHNEVNAQRIFNGGVIYDTGSTSSSSSASSLSSLLSLAGSSSSLSSLADLLGSTSSTSSSSTSSTTSDLTQMILDMVEAQGGDTSAVRGIQMTASDFGKTADTAKSTSDDAEFATSLANSLLDSFFTALALGLSSDTVVETFKDWMRPLFPTLATTSDDTSTDDTTADDGQTDDTTDDSSTDDTTDGGGIEDIDTDQTGNDDSESIV